MKKLLKNENGSSNVLIVLSMTLLISMAAMVVDFGTAYIKTSQTQTAADAAVLAAGLYLPVKEADLTRQAEIKNIAKNYLVKNGITNSSEAEVYFTNIKNGCYFSIGINVPEISETGFSKIMGINEITFTRSAEACAIPCSSTADTVPLAVKKTTLENLIATGNTSHVILKYGTVSSDLGSGAFGAIDLDGVKGGGANDYSTWLQYGYSGELKIGDVLPVEPGNMANPTYYAISARYNSCTHFPTIGGCTKDHYDASCPRVMKVNVVEYLYNYKYVRILGFAAFVLEDYTTYQSSGCVVGSYVDMVNIGSEHGDTSGTAANYGVYSLALSK